MNFSRILEQARDLWARPAGRWVLGSMAVLVAVAALAGYVISRPGYATLGTFDGADASKVAQKLNEAKILYKQSGSGFTFSVPNEKLYAAKLVLADINLDPIGTIWSPDLWKDRVSWSNTEFDKRRLWVEQTETNLARAIKALSVVDQARVQISVPTEKPLFKEQEKQPKATVVVLPKRGEELTPPVVESIMEVVAGAVEGLEPAAVVVMDAARSRVVSGSAFQREKGLGDQIQSSTDQLSIMDQVQNRWQQVLTEQLERVVGLGNVAVIVNPQINWDRVMVEAKEYRGTGPGGKGVPVSESTIKKSTESQPNASGQEPVGVTPNAELGVPTYPGQSAAQAGLISQEEANAIVNYLVDEIKTITDRPGGAIEEIAVGIFVNETKVEPAMELAVKSVVTTAMGSRARVEVRRMAFAPTIFDQLQPRESPPFTDSRWPTWLLALLAGAVAIGLLLFALVALRPREQLLQPIFSGPDLAMMGGIPVADYEPPTPFSTMAAASEATAVQPEPAAKQVPRTPEELASLPPAEVSQLGDEFLANMGIDPAKIRMREKIEKVAKANPEAVATLIKTWISGG